MVSASPLPVPVFPTTATSPLADTSIAYGRKPADITRCVGSTLVPSMESTTILLSASRVTSALLPSGAKTIPLGPDFSPPTVTLPAAVTVVPAMVKTETVPSARLATSARLPVLLMATPAAPLPACRVARTLGAGAGPLEISFLKKPGRSGEMSMTVSLSSGMVLAGSAGSICVALVTSAISSLGETATLEGGPTTLAGALTSASTLGGEARMSMKEMVSGGGLFTTSTLPLTSMTLASLAETASCA